MAQRHSIRCLESGNVAELTGSFWRREQRQTSRGVAVFWQHDRDESGEAAQQPQPQPLQPHFSGLATSDPSAGVALVTTVTAIKIAAVKCRRADFIVRRGPLREGLPP